MSRSWMQVPVPEELVADVIRLVADHLDEAGDVSLDTDLPEDAEAGWVWWQNLELAEQQLLAALAETGEVDSWVLADRLGRSPRELGGVVGPLNKRMRHERLRPPVRSKQVSVAGQRVKRLSLDPGYRDFIGEIDPIPLVRKPAPRRRSARP